MKTRRPLHLLLVLASLALFHSCTEPELPPFVIELPDQAVDADFMAAGADTKWARPLATKAIAPDAACRDPLQSPQVRAESLLSLMTLEEKIGQMTQAERGELYDPALVASWGIGSVLSGGGSAPSDPSPQGWADMYDTFQAQALRTRLAIPLLYGIDAVHGNNNVQGSTIFPHNIGLGASGDAELAQKIAQATALEMKGLGLDWTFAPCIAVPQDSRWGRTYEGYGDKPDLVSRLGLATIRGFEQEGIISTAKHYLADGGTSGGQDRGSANMDEKTLRSLFLPPYQAAVAAGVPTIMVSFSSWNGSKMHGNRYLITDVLKGELGFQGLVISDWDGIKELPGSYVDQISTAVNAGLDMAMVPNSFADFERSLLYAVQTKKVPMERIDDAVLRILKVKFASGIFEKPFAEREFMETIGNTEHHALAREAAAKSVVVLENKSVLPLPREGIKIAVFGNAMDDIGLQCGGWTLSWQGKSGPISPGTTILEGMRQLAPGADIVTPDPDAIPEGLDLAVVCAAEQPYAEMKGDNPHPVFRPSEAALIAKLKGQGLTVVTVLISGRPLALENVASQSDALLAAWLPGSEGAGIADVLFGIRKPQGTLPMAWPKSARTRELSYPRGHGLGW